MTRLLIRTLDLFFTRKQMIRVVDAMMSPLQYLRGMLRVPRPHEIISAEELLARLNSNQPSSSRQDC